jgi:glyoxylase-like metal-dependent hydrolase (beta-lactamase superfamily II)
MNITNLCPGGYAANCYLVTSGDAAVLIDCTAPAATVVAALERANARLSAILLTHGHFDHMLTLADVQAATGASIYLASGDADLPADGEKNAFSVFFGYDHSYPAPDRLLNDSEVLAFGDMTLRVMCTPGHTRGSALYLAGDIAFTGDTVFAAGFGRYDLYGGDPLALRESLEKISLLPPDTLIYPGHGEQARLSDALATIKGFI